MCDEVSPKQTPVWDLAWSWVIRQHERDSFDAAAAAELACWLATDPIHRQVFDKASRLWLMAGLVPPVNDLDIRECAERDG
jgi:transmembrane sensor